MTIDVLKQSTDIADRPNIRECLSAPALIEFPSRRGNAYAWYYAPLNSEFAAPSEELPPLVVKSHGGPTAAASSTLDLRTQYWTSRGYAVLDVDYGGSTGYGRDYRNRLHQAWGIVDVEDCTNAGKFIVENRKADPARVAITGGSAGGYTTLCALVFGTFFKVGASYYGVCDLESLARDTHKFESRYLEWLIGTEHKSLACLCSIAFYRGRNWSSVQNLTVSFRKKSGTNHVRPKITSTTSTSCRPAASLERRTPRTAKRHRPEAMLHRKTQSGVASAGIDFFSLMQSQGDGN